MKNRCLPQNMHVDLVYFIGSTSTICGYTCNLLWVIALGKEKLNKMKTDFKSFFKMKKDLEQSE